ncbi:MAG TPA: hypothetical protein PK280_20180, partial [Planctomycetota bacterium]|nr:hypothetical protein [Planctomycetota bacterium]
MPGWSPRTGSSNRGGAAQVVVVLLVIALVAGGAFLIFRGKGKPSDESVPGGPARPVVDKTSPAPVEKPAPAPTGPVKPADPVPVQPAAPTAAALAELDGLYNAQFLEESTKDRKQWETLRNRYSELLLKIDAPAERKPVVEKLNKLNEKVLFSRDYITADSVAHKVEAGETIEKIALDSGLPRDCSGSIIRINRTSPLTIRQGESLKVIKPLKMDLRVSKKHLRLTAYLNGYFFGEHGLGPERRFAYEEGIRSPFVVRHPRRVKAGSRRRELVICQDIAPTFIALAGGRPGPQIQGRSLLPLL